MDVSFKIGPDEAVALVGPNGAGKTTIVKLLTRLYDPDEGQILIDGVDIREYDLQSLHDAVGVIFQDYVTYFFSAGDNIGVGRLEEMQNRERVETSAVKSGADRVITRLPKGYDTTLGRWFDEGYQLSGGEWQKVALARAFMRDAAILILDEPTASLDARAEYEIFAHMKELTAGQDGRVHQPPLQHGAPGRPHLRAGERHDQGGRQPRRPARPRRHLRRAVQSAGGGVPVTLVVSCQLSVDERLTTDVTDQLTTDNRQLGTPWQTDELRHQRYPDYCRGNGGRERDGAH